MVDGEIVIATPRGLDFDALQLRLHPAASRVAKLAQETPAAFVAFDALAVDGQDLRDVAQSERRERLEQLLARRQPPIHLTPMTRDPRQASEWLSRFEGAGLDGVIAKPAGGTYQPGKRAMIKVKHVANRRLRRRRLSLAQGGKRRARRLAAARAVRRGSTPAPRRRDFVVHDGDDAEQLAVELAPLRERALEDASLARVGRGGRRRDDPDAWGPEPMERGQGSVVGAAAHRARLRGEVRPHAGTAVPSRGGLSALAPDKRPSDCGYDQLEVTTPYELEKVFGAGRRDR